VAQFSYNGENNPMKLLNICSIHRLMIVAACLTFAAFSPGQDLAKADLSKLLQKGLLSEEVDGDLSKAVTEYEALLAAFEGERKFAATAIFRIGECYRQQEKLDEAAPYFARIVAEFGDIENLARLSKANLAAMGKGISNSTDTSERDAQLADPETVEIAQLEELIAESPDLVNASPYPLHQAVQRSHLRVAKFLLENGADRELNGSSGLTPLAVAAHHGHRAMAELLLDHGADINGDSGRADRKLPVTVALINVRPTIALLLVERGSTFDEASFDALCKHTRNAPDKLVPALLKRNDFDVNKIGKSIPLVIAASRQNEPVMRMLIEAGADVNQKDAD